MDNFENMTIADYIELGKRLEAKMDTERNNITSTIDALNEEIRETELQLKNLNDAKAHFEAELAALGNVVVESAPLEDEEEEDTRTDPQKLKDSLPEYEGPVPYWGRNLESKTLTLLKVFEGKQSMTVGEYRLALAVAHPGVFTSGDDQLSIRFAALYNRGYLTRVSKKQGQHRYKLAPAVHF